MVRRIASSITRTAKPATQTRIATVLDILQPTTDEADVATGWQVLLDFGGGEVRRAGVASSYNPVPGDTVVVARYLNTLFVIDRQTAGDTGDAPGGRVGYAYYSGTLYGTIGTVPANSEVAFPELAVSVDLRNGAAYEVEIGGIAWSCSVANTQVLWRLRENGPTGLDLGEWFRRPSAEAGAIHGVNGSHIIRNDNGVDLTLTIALTCATPPAVIASFYANAVTRPFMEVTVKGSSKLYPHASPVPPPPALSN